MRVSFDAHGCEPTVHSRSESCAGLDKLEHPRSSLLRIKTVRQDDNDDMHDGALAIGGDRTIYFL